jgi:hypothetical protein
VLVARARLVNKDDAKGVHGFARRVVSRSTPAPPCPSNDPLRAWLPKTLVAEFRAIAAQISANFATPAGQATQAPTDEGYSLIASFLLLALIRAARGLVATRTSSNPTNFRATARKTTFGISGLGPAWLAAVAAMGEQLQATTTGVDQMISLGDARLLATPRGADFVLTSPPYCTRLDYGDATRFEIAAMSPMEHENFDQLRRSLMGVPLVRGKAKPVVPKEWPDSLQTLLGAIRGHQSKASDSYYFKTYYQYFEDLYASLRRISSAMRANSSAAIVVQTSYYKEIPIALPDLFVDVALSLSLDAEVVHRMPVRTVLASIHPGTRRYRSNWKYEESVVLLRKGVAQ